MKKCTQHSSGKCHAISYDLMKKDCRLKENALSMSATAMNKISVNMNCIGK